MPDRYWPMHRIGKEEHVWLAKDVDTDNEVVMKRMERETNSDYYERNEQVHQEAATLKELAELYPKRIIGYSNIMKRTQYPCTHAILCGARIQPNASQQRKLHHPWLREVSPARSSLGRTSRGRPCRLQPKRSKDTTDGCCCGWPTVRRTTFTSRRGRHPGDKPGAPPAWMNPFEHHQSAKVIDATSAASAANSGTKVNTNTPAATALPAPPPQKPGPSQRRHSTNAAPCSAANLSASVQSSFSPPSQDASPKRSVTFACPSAAGSRRAHLLQCERL
ncbi:hypothetical protein DFJ73DRAFT_967292 [Zopfochytrium polystomum]|nr:hypothetical protein DFJ73DRAFT_967292 [Zopfochytrium polystomum]